LLKKLCKTTPYAAIFMKVDFNKPKPVYSFAPAARGSSSSSSSKPAAGAGAAAASASSSTSSSASASAADVEKLDKQRVIVADLKKAKADKAQIDAAVKELLRLKELVGDAPAAAPAPEKSATGAGDAEKLEKQRVIVADLKKAKADKAQIDAAVKELLRLKELVGEVPPPKKSEEEAKAPEKKKPAAAPA